MYEEAISWMGDQYAIPTISSYFDLDNRGWGSLELMTYEADVTVDEILALWPESEIEVEGPITAKIDGVNVSGELYQWSMDGKWSAGSEPSSGGAEDETESDLIAPEGEFYAYTEYIAIFTVGDDKFVIHYYLDGDQELTLPEFEIINTQSDFERIEEIVGEFETVTDVSSYGN